MTYMNIMFDGTERFMRYHPVLKTWEQMAELPGHTGNGTQLVSDGQRYMYLLTGGVTTTFFKYDTITDSWSPLQGPILPVEANSAVTYVSTGTGSIYLYLGNATNGFYHYDIASNTWSSKGILPVSPNLYGIDIAWDGSDGIYALYSSVSAFRKYSISAGTWSAALALPTSPSVGLSRLVYEGNGTFLMLRNHTSLDRMELYRYTVSTNAWELLADPPSGNIQDYRPMAAYDSVSRTLYTFGGYYYHPDMYGYSVAQNSWNQEYKLYGPYLGYSHGQPIYDGVRYVYYPGGPSVADYRYIYRLDLTTKTTTIFTTTPTITNTIDKPNNGVLVGDSIYYYSYYTSTAFWKLSLTTGLWESLAVTPIASNYGSGLVDGGDGNLYGVLGASQALYKYNIVDNAWTTMAVPTMGTNAGGGLTKVGAYLYMTSGNATSLFARYSIAGNTWSAMPEVPNGFITHGGSITSDGSRYVYVTASDRSIAKARSAYRFDTTDSTWHRIADLPADPNVVSYAFWDAVGSRLFFAPGLDSVNLWYWNPGSTAYQASGIWYSKTLDLTGVESWGQLESTVTGAGATFATRSSLDGLNWSAWQDAASGTIASPARRYIQLRLTMAGGGTATPRVSNIKVNYNSDATAPSLPSQLQASSVAISGVTLQAGQPYEYQHPVFSWSGSSDGANGSGIDGYYVYYGTNSSADPQQDGSYQSGSTYTVTAPMTYGEIYYLRIKVKDKSGNVSAAGTFFSYVYAYISPPGTSLATTQADFTSGNNTGLDLTSSGDSVKLVQSAQGAWGLGAGIPIPGVLRDDAGLEIVDDYVYILGTTLGGVRDFKRYNRTAGLWEQLTSAPADYSYGALINGKDGYLYMMRGASSTDFYRYRISTNQWEALPALPQGAVSASDMVMASDGKIYFIYGNSRSFFQYDPVTGVTSALTSLPQQVGTTGGSGIWADTEGSLYALLGSTGSTSKGFYRYDIVRDLWVTPSQPPQIPYLSYNNLVSDGQGNLYVTATDKLLNNTAKAMKYNIATNIWSAVEGAYLQVGSSAMVVSDEERYVYFTQGVNGTSILVAYDSWNNKFEPEGYWPEADHVVRWETVTRRDITVSTASATTTDGTNTYMINNGYKEVVKFNPATNKTEYILAPPITGDQGGLAYSNGYLYYAAAGSTAVMYRYDFALRWWERMTDIPGTLSLPGHNYLIADQAGNLYTNRGSLGTQYYRYTPDSGKGTWTTMAPLPTAFTDGASFVYDGADTIYALRATAAATAKFHKYTISTNQWSTLPNLAVTITNASSLYYRSGKLYAQVGGACCTTTAASALYTYDVASTTWSSGLAGPTAMNRMVSMLPLDDNRALSMPGTLLNLMIPYVFPSANTAFNTTGTHISQPIQVDGLFDYAGIRAEATIPDNTGIEFYTRSSANGSTWEEWKKADQLKVSGTQLSARIASTPQKFTEVKAVLRSYDNVFTPTLGSYSLDYYSDTNPPTNPTVLQVFSDSSKSTALQSEQWYSHPQPMVDWPDSGQSGGAADGLVGSRIEGYYVYVGTDQTASPQTAGTFVTASEYNPTLTASGTYYVRLQSVDHTGNIDPVVFAPFIYKLDIDTPSSPALISVDPSGYTSINNFSFEWPAASDGHSGIDKYCYRSGAQSGAFATENCISGRTVSNIDAAYQQGANVFYVRTRDIAGNYSASATEVSYYYTTAPPGPVTNLESIPGSSAQNLFSFSWDLPATYSGNAEQLTYCYSINVLPSSTNTTCTQDRFIAPFAAATQQGANVLYVVAKDEANNVNWASYASTTFNANTASPGIPLNLVVTDTSDRATERWILTLTWNKPVFEGNGIARYLVERSDDGHTFAEIGTATSLAFVDLGILPDKLYYYRVRAVDDVNNKGGASAVVAKQAKGQFASPPEIVSQPVTTAGFSQATISWVTARPATSFVYYGTDPQNLSQSKGTLNLTTEHSLIITGLTPQTTYYFKVQSFDIERSYDLEAAFSGSQTFQTESAAQIQDVRISDIGLTSAVLRWTTTVLTTAKIDYGLAGQGYGLRAEDSASSTVHTLKLEELQPGHGYTFRITAIANTAGEVQSDEYAFDTIPYPVAYNIGFQPSDSASELGVIVTWTTNVPADSTISYQAEGIQDEVSNSDLTTEHSMRIGGLASNTEYTFSIKGRDKYGNTVSSELQKWRSQVDTRPAVIQNLNVEITPLGGPGSTKAMAIVTWQTDEPTTSQVRFGDGSTGKLEKETTLNTTLSNSHTAVIPDFELGGIYRIQPVSRDISGNFTYGEEVAVTTPRRQQTILDALIELATKLFGSKK
jgi:hypothetical protein